jgi:hypothetical protein
MFPHVFLSARLQLATPGLHYPHPMPDLFDPSNQKPTPPPSNPSPRTLAPEDIVFLFFYFALGAGIFFAWRYLIPATGTPSYFAIPTILLAALWLHRKFLRRS